MIYIQTLLWRLQPYLFFILSFNTWSYLDFDLLQHGRCGTLSVASSSPSGDRGRTTGKFEAASRQTDGHNVLLECHGLGKFDQGHIITEIRWRILRVHLHEARIIMNCRCLIVNVKLSKKRKFCLIFQFFQRLTTIIRTMKIYHNYNISRYYYRYGDPDIMSTRFFFTITTTIKLQFILQIICIQLSLFTKWWFLFYCYSYIYIKCLLMYHWKVKLFSLLHVYKI